MKKVALLLAALASGKRASYSVAQVQRILFLIDRNIPEAIDGPAFRFALRDRGPFDPRVYTLLEELTTDGFAAPAPLSSWRASRKRESVRARIVFLPERSGKWPTLA